MTDLIKKLTDEVQALKRGVQGLPMEQTVSGTTSSSANASKLFRHLLKKRPSRWYAVVGDVYVKDMTPEQIDIRSTQTSQDFTIIVEG